VNGSRKRFRRIGLALGATLVAGILFMEVYTRVPVGERTPDLGLAPDSTAVVLVIHGAGDADDPLVPEILRGLDAAFGDRPEVAVRYLRWSPESDQRLRAAATAQAVGARVGESLASLPGMRDLHLVAHSVGAFMPDAICRAYRQRAARPARVTMVLLDPFQIGGFLDWGWGARHQGECADFALAVINTDDPAPATNRPLANAFNLDVTGDPARERFGRNGHYWPIRYYIDHLLVDQPALAGRDHAEWPRGGVRPGIR
jgi:hypothetical protein